MPRISKYSIILSLKERMRLEEMRRSYSLPFWRVIRARMILMAADGHNNEEIAQALSTQRAVVSRWRQRFYSERLAGLADRPRSGRPRSK